MGLGFDKEDGDAMGKALGQELIQGARAIVDQVLGPGLILKFAPGTKVKGVEIEGEITVRVAK